MRHRVFLLSPARCAGKRAELLFSDRAQFDLARKLRQARGVPLGEVFSFLSGLYFRGKLAYASAFGNAPRGVAKALVITPQRGLLPASTHVTIEDLQSFAEVPIDLSEPRYVEPLVADAKRLARRMAAGQIVLLGSVATTKYSTPLTVACGDRLCYPKEFIGRGDMSRGGLMLRAVDAGCELEYQPLSAVRMCGSRPPRLGPRVSRVS
jgi:hypothetical protein